MFRHATSGLRTIYLFMSAYNSLSVLTVLLLAFIFSCNLICYNIYGEYRLLLCLRRWLQLRFDLDSPPIRL